MRIKAKLSIEQAIQSRDRLRRKPGHDPFPKGTVSVSYDPSTDERRIGVLSVTLVGDGESWKLDGELLGERVRVRDNTLFQPDGLAEALDRAIRSLLKTAQGIHGTINALEDEAFLRSVGLVTS